jgi:hypothetical protein
MSDSQENTAFAKVELLLSENLDEKWGLVSKVVNETDYYFQIYSPPGLFGPKLMAEIKVLDHRQRITLQIVHANESQKAILYAAFNEMYIRLPQIPFSQE